MGNIFVDNASETGSLTGTDWKFTNGSKTVTEQSVAGNAIAELSVDDWVRSTGGVQWYKVASITDNDNFEIDINFQQGTVTAVAKFNNEDGSADPSTYPAVGNEAVPDITIATTQLVRSAGDIIRVRGGRTYVSAGLDITIDEDGTANNHIELRGIYTAAGDDSWGDGDVSKPIIDFDDTAFQFFFNSDNYWKVTNLEIMQSADNDGAIRFNVCFGFVVSGCDIHDNSARGIRIDNASGEILDSTFVDNVFAHIDFARSACFIDGCTLNGGVGGTQRGVNAAASIVLLNSSFGVTTEHSVGDIILDNQDGQVTGRNVVLGSTAPVVNSVQPGREQSFVRIEDYQQVHEAYRGFEFAGDVTRSVVIERSGEGGTDWSMLMEPDPNCGSEQALHGFKYPPRGLEIQLDGTEQVITVKAYATSWASLPSVSEFVVELEHFESVGVWQTDTSSDTFSSNDPNPWDTFDITLTPGAAGKAYLRVKLLDYIDGTEKVYIDPVPLIDGLRDESLISPTVDGVGAGYEIVKSGMLVHPGMAGGIRG